MALEQNEKDQPCFEPTTAGRHSLASGSVTNTIQTIEQTLLGIAFLIALTVAEQSPAVGHGTQIPWVTFQCAFVVVELALREIAFLIAPVVRSLRRAVVNEARIDVRLTRTCVDHEDFARVTIEISRTLADGDT